MLIDTSDVLILLTIAGLTSVYFYFRLSHSDAPKDNLANFQLSLRLVCCKLSEIARNLF